MFANMKKLSECIKQNRLKCYADDFLFVGDTEAEMKIIVEALKYLDGPFNLKLNIKKSTILSSESLEQISGIRVTKNG